MARDPARNAEQAHALYSYHQQGPGSIERSARRLLISPRTMYAMSANELTAPACIIGPLWDLYGDEALVRGLIGKTERPFIFAAAPAAGIACDVTASCAFIASTGRALETAADAIADGKLDDSERAKLLPELEELERRVATLKAVLRGGK